MIAGLVKFIFLTSGDFPKKKNVFREKISLHSKNRTYYNNMKIIAKKYFDYKLTNITKIVFLVNILSRSVQPFRKSLPHRR